KRFAAVALLLVAREELRQSLGQLLGRNAHADAAAKAFVTTYAAAEEDLKGFALLAVDRHQRALKPDIADVMLAAGVRTARDADAHAVVHRHMARQVLVQLDSAILGFGNGQLAELHAGAGDDAAPRPARL